MTGTIRGDDDALKLYQEKYLVDGIIIKLRFEIAQDRDQAVNKATYLNGWNLNKFD